MRVLYVEDSPVLLRTVRRALRHTGYAVDTAADGEAGLASAELHEYDLVILDVMLPKLDGLEVLRRMRAVGRQTHVLLLTARDTVADRVQGLRIGADDYLVKPFALDELLARVEALCRRAHGAKTNELQIGPVTLDFSARDVRLDGAPIVLTAREWRLLEYLARRRGEVVPRMEIEEHIYDEFVAPMSNVVDAAVYSLRQKLGPGLIHTRRGLGYVLDAK